jgi:phosphoribosylformylglycinamidine synthase
MIEPSVWRALGLTDEEYTRIEQILSREPTPTELAMFSVEWSEHCGYPRSRRLLSLLPRKGKYPVVVGGDAGGIMLPGGLAVLFKVESHNHPSQVEPKQGAATGVGGILRDIFTMGARPIALMNSLRFGELKEANARFLLAGVVDGIQFYGNCIGVPTVGGEIEFEDCYKGNCLVNVMCLGVVEGDKIMPSAAKGPGNAVMYVGNSTGRDGIGGCSILASHEFSAEDEKRPTVQIGDPFAEKCLLEACLEAAATGAIVAMKDMGAAGLTCTTSEMAAAGEVGMDVDLQLVPRREQGMLPWELMMSESQERMLLVVQRGREDEAAAIFRKWGLNARVIGRITADPVLRIRDGQELAAEISAAALAKAPIYNPEQVRPAYLDEVQGRSLSDLPVPADWNRALLDVVQSPNVASKRWVYEQYDHMVQTNTTVLPGADAAVLRLRGRREGLALKMDGHGRYCYLDPYVGAQIAVAEAARNVACVGAQPAAITDGLNFGNPDKPDRYWQFARCVEGVVEACRALELAVVSGNVSFYNEAPDAAIYPTPIIGMVGVLPDVEKRCDPPFKRAGDVVLLAGQTKPELGGSEYLKVVHGLVAGRPPSIDLEVERKVQEFCLKVIGAGLARSAHDCSDGGLGVALAECCVQGGLGARIRLPEKEGLGAAEWLFSESQSRIVFSTAPHNLAAVMSEAAKAGVPITQLGEAGGDRLTISLAGAAGPAVDLPVAGIEAAYEGGLKCAMQ